MVEVDEGQDQMFVQDLPEYYQSKISQMKMIVRYHHGQSTIVSFSSRNLYDTHHKTTDMVRVKREYSQIDTLRHT